MTGLKYDGGKPMFVYIPPYIQEEVAKVLTFGAQKYEPRSWRGLDNFEDRYLSAAQRHINAIQKGELYDPESGLLHHSHAICCLMFLGEVILEKQDSIDTARKKEILGMEGDN